jgi:hypothetical protein
MLLWHNLNHVGIDWNVKLTIWSSRAWWLFILITARLPSFSVSAGRFFIALFVAAIPEINEHDLSLSHWHRLQHPVDCSSTSFNHLCLAVSSHHIRCEGRLQCPSINYKSSEIFLLLQDHWTIKYIYICTYNQMCFAICNPERSSATTTVQWNFQFPCQYYILITSIQGSTQEFVLPVF